MSERGGDFVNKYEVMFIARPLEDEAVKPIIEFVDALLKKNGAKVEKIEPWGKRHFAYPVKKNRMTGTMSWLISKLNLTLSKKLTA